MEKERVTVEVNGFRFTGVAGCAQCQRQAARFLETGRVEGPGHFNGDGCRHKRAGRKAPPHCTCNGCY
jgi:hypothetical protein